MARALIVGCGCRGRALGQALTDQGWRLRGTTRSPEGLGAIERAGIEPVVADPDRVATILDHVGDVTVVVWALGSAVGRPESLAALHGPRLERLLEELVDTPVRGFAYEAAGRVPDAYLRSGAAVVRAASERWRIPVELLRHSPDDPAGWVTAATAAVLRLVEVP